MTIRDRRRLPVSARRRAHAASAWPPRASRRRLRRRVSERCRRRTRRAARRSAAARRGGRRASSRSTSRRPSRRRAPRPRTITRGVFVASPTPRRRARRPTRRRRTSRRRCRCGGVPTVASTNRRDGRRAVIVAQRAPHDDVRVSERGVRPDNRGRRDVPLSVSRWTTSSRRDCGEEEKREKDESKKIHLRRRDGDALHLSGWRTLIYALAVGRNKQREHRGRRREIPRRRTPSVEAAIAAEDEDDRAGRPRAAGRVAPRTRDQQALAERRVDETRSAKREEVRGGCATRGQQGGRRSPRGTRPRPSIEASLRKVPMIAALLEDVWGTSVSDPDRVSRTRTRGCSRTTRRTRRRPEGGRARP